MTIERREPERNGSRDGGSDRRSRRPSRIAGLGLLDQDLEVLQIEAQLVREAERGELPGGDEAVDREAASKSEVGRGLLGRQESLLRQAQLVSVSGPAVIMSRAAVFRAGSCMHLRDRLSTA